MPVYDQDKGWGVIVETIIIITVKRQNYNYRSIIIKKAGDRGGKGKGCSSQSGVNRGKKREGALTLHHPDRPRTSGVGEGIGGFAAEPTFPKFSYFYFFT